MACLFVEGFRSFLTPSGKQQVVESVKSGQFTEGEDNTGLSVRWGVVFTVVEYSTRWSLDKAR